MYLWNEMSKLHQTQTQNRHRITSVGYFAGALY